MVHHIANRLFFDPNTLILTQVTSSRVENEFGSDEAPRWSVILWGVLGTFLSHTMLFLLVPETLLVTAVARPETSWQEFDIILNEEEEVNVIKEYVPVNRADLDNPPDETDYFAAQNTQAANEKLSEELNETTPFVEGESEEFNNVVTGNPVSLPPSPPVPPSAASNTDPRQQQDPSQPKIQIFQPLSPDELDQQRTTAPVAFEEEALEEEGPRSLPEAPEEMEDEEEDEFVERERDDEEDTTRNRNEVAQQETPLRPFVPPSPQPNPEDRPERLPQPRVRYSHSGPLKRHLSGVSRLANFANYSAEFSEFGEYLDRMFETIELEWHKLIFQQRLSERRSRVSVAYLLNADGEIVNYEIIGATSSLQAQIVCAAAVTNRAPFGEWTEEMKGILEDPERIVVNFIFF